MRVVQALPPLIDEIDAAFGVRGKPVLFAWGDTIFSPGGGAIGPALMAHEAVHGRRQGADVEGWWRRYIAEPEFRLAEELPAHQAEFNVLCELERRRWKSERNMRRTLAAHVARRLAAPLYRWGGPFNVERAKELLMGGSEAQLDYLLKRKVA